LFASKDPKEVSDVTTKRHCSGAPAENHGKGNKGKGNNGKSNNSKEPWQRQQWQGQQRQWAKPTAKWARNTATAATTKNHGNGSNGNNGKEPWQQRHKPRKGSNESNGQEQWQKATTTAMGNNNSNGQTTGNGKHAMGKQFNGQRACKFSVKGINPPHRSTTTRHDSMGKGQQWAKAKDNDSNGQRQMATTAMGKGK
jgi:hypothetical protein